MIRMKWIENYNNSCFEKENIFERLTILNLKFKNMPFSPHFYL